MITIECEKTTEISANLIQFQFNNPGFSWRVGQYCVLNLDDNDKIYLAIASHPKEKNLTFIVSKSSKFSTFLSEKKQIQCSSPEGPGFNDKLFNFSSLLAISHGTGISAIRPVLWEALINKKETLFIYGCKSPTEYPSSEEFKQVKKSLAFSQTENKHVQDHIRSLQLSDSRNTGVFLVGSNEFQDSVISSLMDKGFLAENISKNF
jgi:NAD(P)H-flavin reductase